MQTEYIQSVLHNTHPGKHYDWAHRITITKVCEYRILRPFEAFRMKLICKSTSSIKNVIKDHLYLMVVI